MIHRSDPTPLAVCYGTRPQIIKASALVPALRRRWPVLTVDTGQHYDYRLNQVFYEELEITRADLFLEVGSGSHAVQTSHILTRSTEVYAQHSPWAVVVIGDTNSTLGCALAAVKMRIPVVHVEAGLRGTDPFMAEEINRRVVDAVSNVLCAPSVAAAERLRREAAHGEIVRTGDIAYDVLRKNLERATTNGNRAEAENGPFVFATLHRAELTDDPKRLRDVLRALASLAYPVIFPVHPRTRAMMERERLDREVPGHVRLQEPLSYLETLHCTSSAAAVVTDSGGVQREAYWLGKPCVTVRSHTEWVETVETGANVVVDPANVGRLPDVVARRIAATSAEGGWDRSAYGEGDAADRIAAAIETFAARPAANG